MSSILTALKRVETDGSGNPTTPPRPMPWMARGPVHATGSDRLWEALITGGRRWLAAGLALAALVAAGAVVGSLGPAIYDKTRHRQPSVNTPPSRPTIAPANAAISEPEHGRVTTDLPSTARSVVTPPAKEPSPLTEQPTPVAIGTGPLPTLQGNASGPAPPVAGPSPTTLKIVRPQPPTPPQRSAKNRPMAENTGKPVAPPATFLPLPAEAQLHLQAVSWSEAAQRCIAVINNRVLHTDEAVAGYAISRIDPEAVILSRAGATYRLTFRPR